MTRRPKEPDPKQAAEQLASWMALCAGLKKAVAVFAAAPDKREVAERFAEPLTVSVLAICVRALVTDVENAHGLLGDPDAVNAFRQELQRIHTGREQRSASHRGRHAAGNGKKRSVRKRRS